jgi:hypothetical protein
MKHPTGAPGVRGGRKIAGTDNFRISSRSYYDKSSLQPGEIRSRPGKTLPCRLVVVPFLPQAGTRQRIEANKRVSPTQYAGRAYSDLSI